MEHRTQQNEFIKIKSDKMLRKSILILFSWLLVNSMAQAVLTIEITQGAEGAQAIAVVPFEWKGK